MFKNIIYVLNNILQIISRLFNFSISFRPWEIYSFRINLTMLFVVQTYGLCWYKTILQNAVSCSKVSKWNLYILTDFPNNLLEHPRSGQCTV